MHETAMFSGLLFRESRERTVRGIMPAMSSLLAFQLLGMLPAAESPGAKSIQGFFLLNPPDAQAPTEP